MVWVTLAIAPVLVLLTFEVRFLPYHSSPVTWWHRLLIAFDLAGVLLLWAGVLDAQRDITWRGLVQQGSSLLAASLLILFSFVVVTFPGERQGDWLRFGPRFPVECNSVFSIDFFTDRLVLTGENLIDPEKLAATETAASARGLANYEIEPTRHLAGRDFMCSRFDWTDLRRADLIGTNLQGSRLIGAQLQGARLDHVDLRGAYLASAHFQGANLPEAQFQGAYLNGAQFQGAHMNGAYLQGSILTEAQFQGANLISAHFQFADLSRAELQGARILDTELQGALLRGTQLQGTFLFGAKLDLADISHAYLWRAPGPLCKDTDTTQVQVIGPQFDQLLEAQQGPRGGQLKVAPADMEEFIKRTTCDMPEATKQSFQATLHAAFAGDAKKDKQTVQGWNDCKARSPKAEEYPKKYADYLVSLVCSVEPNLVNQKYVVEALAIFRDDALALGLSGLNEKPCPVLNELGEMQKKMLKTQVTTRPADAASGPRPSPVDATSHDKS